MGIGVLAFALVFGLSSYGISAKRAQVAKENINLKTQIVNLKKHQVRKVVALDGVQIKNLSDKKENK